MPLEISNLFRTRSRSALSVADARLENTTPSTDCSGRSVEDSYFDVCVRTF